MHLPDSACLTQTSALLQTSCVILGDCLALSELRVPLVEVGTGFSSAYCLPICASLQSSLQEEVTVTNIGSGI